MDTRSPPIGTEEPDPKREFSLGDYVVLDYTSEQRDQDEQFEELDSTIWQIRGSFVQTNDTGSHRKYRVDPADSVSERGIAIFDQTELVAATEHKGAISFHKPSGEFKYIDSFAKATPSTATNHPSNNSEKSPSNTCPVCGSNRAVFVGNTEAGIHFKQYAACGYEPPQS